MNDTVRIAVIGNASAGKTSFLRTLMRNYSFGEVRFLPSTNSKNEISDGNVTFIDTPGFQCAELVREWAVEAFQKLERPSPEKIIDIILKHQDRTNLQLQDGVIKHDLIAWQALKNADVILFLVNIRKEPKRGSNLESSCLLLPDAPGTLFIFNFLPSDKTELEKRRKPWDIMKNDWGIQGTFLDYDAFHRDYKDEENILQHIKTKLSDSSKAKQMERYIQKRADAEEFRLRESFKMVISLIQSLSEISCYIENVPKKTTDKENSDFLYEKFYSKLYESIKSNLSDFCNSILDIWDFRIPVDSDSNLLGMKIIISQPMSKLVKFEASEISRILTQKKVNESVWWRTQLSSFIPIPTGSLRPPFLFFKRIYGGVSLRSQTDLLNSFIPCALDFIKKVRERGIATPSSLYHLSQDDPCQDENKIKFIMPTEPGVVNIDAAFKDFKWKSQKAAQEWIPELLKRFGMPKNS